MEEKNFLIPSYYENNEVKLVIDYRTTGRFENRQNDKVDKMGLTVSFVLRKPVLGCLSRSDADQAIRAQKMARG